MQIALFSDTGRRIVCINGVSCWNAWEALQTSVASHYEVPVDAVAMTEDDEGTEVVTVEGVRKGHIETEISGVRFGVPANRDDDAAQAAVRSVLTAAE